MDVSESVSQPPKPLRELKFLLQSACSFSIQFDDGPNVVTKEQSLVVKDMEKLVEEDERMIKRIMNGIEIIFFNEPHLKKALLPSILKKEGVTFVMEQESLIRILLRVKLLQDPVFDLIKQELFRVCSETEDCCLLRLLLNPLKYLPNINDAQLFSTDVLDCLELCAAPMQLEILDSLPDIIPDSAYDCVAQQLVKLLSSEDSPSDAVIECFGAFDFAEDVKEAMFSQLMDKILPKQSGCMPASLKLLFNTQKGKISTEVVLKLRDMIDNIMRESDDTNLKNSIVKVIQSFANKDNITQSYIDVVNSIEKPKDHKAFDLFILLILGDDTKYKELIRKKIETGHFTPELLNSLLLNKHYFDALASSSQSPRSQIKLGGYLMRFHSTKVEYFVSSLFDAIFRNSVEKQVLLVDAKEVVDCLLKACNNSNMKCVNQSLRIFYSLMKTYPKIFYEHLNKLMGLLKKIDDFDLLASRVAYSILCHIPYVVDPEHPYSEVMRNEISMVVRKQLMSSKRSRKSIGIMGATAQIEGSVSVGTHRECGQGLSQFQLIEMVEPPPPSIQEAVTIIESVTVLTEGIPECTGLFYDELCQLIFRGPIKMDFTVWMLRKTRSLLDNYVVDPQESPKEINGLKITSQYAAGASEKPISLNVGLMSLQPHKYEGIPIMLLAPLFRLFRILISGKFKNTALSELFTSFMSCSFELPVVDDLEDLDCDQLKQVADILFHTINYLKEVVSAISRAISISDSVSQGTVFKDLLRERLLLLVNLESVFNDCLTKVPEHSFSQVYFHDCSKNKQIHETKKKPVKKKAKQSKALLDDSIVSTSILSRKESQTATSTSQSIQKGKRGTMSPSKSLIENNINFREIDLMSLLKIIQYSEGRGAEKLLTYPILVYILKDLVKGFKVTLLGQTDLTHYNWQVKPGDQLKAINKDLNGVVKCFYDLTKSLETSEAYDETHRDLIMSYTYCLETFHIILSVSDEQCSSFIDDIQKVLNPDFNSSGTQKKNRRKLVEILIAQLKYCVVLSQGVLLFQIVDRILGTEQNKHRVELILKLCDDIVFKHWTSPKYLQYSEKQCIQDTKFILEKYFQELKVSYLQELLSKVVAEYTDLKAKTDYLPSLSIINYSNFHVLFITLCSSLRVNVQKEVEFMIKISIQIERRGTRESVQEVRTLKLDQLRLWKNTTNMMFQLMEVARNMKNRQNTLLSVFLKKSIPILKIFIDLGLPLFDVMFPSKMEMVVDILKSMQTSTRFIHHLCCQSKSFKNLALVSHIPSFRLVLEQLIYKVKALLVSHDCEDAFFLGNLKNKDIHGNTQTSELMEEDSQENEEEEDEEMPTDDEVDVTMDDNKSESLTF